MQLEIPSCSGYGLEKALIYKDTVPRLKSMSFYQLTLLSNNHVLMSCLIGTYLESRFLGYGEGCRKHLKKEEKRQKKNIEKCRERKTKNTRKVK